MIWSCKASTISHQASFKYIQNRHYKFSSLIAKQGIPLIAIQKKHLVSTVLNSFNLFRTPELAVVARLNLLSKTWPCCFLPFQIRKWFWIFNRGSMDWIKICGARGSSSGEWRPKMALKRGTCIINHPFLSYSWHVRQGNPCLSEHRQ